MSNIQRVQPMRANDGGQILHGFVAEDSLEVLEVAYPPGLLLPLHAHDRPCLTLVLEGGFVETIDGKSCEMAPDDLLVKPAGVPHVDYMSSEGVRSIVIALMNPDDERLHPFVERIEAVTQRHHPQFSLLARELLAELQGHQPLREVSLWRMVLDLLVQVIRQKETPTAQPDWLKLVLEQLETAFPETPSLEEIATQAGVHPAHLCRAFKKALGCSIGEYVRRLRLGRAGRLLRESDQSLSEVAANCGFYDQSHFCRLFRRWCGMTPREYRAVGRAA